MCMLSSSLRSSAWRCRCWCTWLQSHWPQVWTKLGECHGTKGQACSCIHGIQMGPVSIKVACWLIFRPEVNPTWHVLIQDELSHSMHAASSHSVLQSNLDIEQGGSSYIWSIWILPSGKKMSMHMYFANAVLTTLFQRSFAVTRSAVGTNNSSSYSIKFPPAVMQIWFAPSFADDGQPLGWCKWFFYQLGTHVVSLHVSWQTLCLYPSGLSCCCLVPYPVSLFQTQFAKFLQLQDRASTFYNLI